MATAPQAVALTREEQHIQVAKKLFYGGLAFLPWLWILNLIYFRSSLLSKDGSPQLKKCTWAHPCALCCVNAPRTPHHIPAVRVLVLCVR